MAKQKGTKEKGAYEQLLEKIKDGSYMREIQEKQEALGLIDVMAYCCNRCHYLWFPKDFELGNDDILELEPPKACARCKSRYWNKQPVRKTDATYFEHEKLWHIMTGLPTLRARHRKGKLDFKVPNCECQHCKSIVESVQNN